MWLAERLRLSHGEEFTFWAKVMNSQAGLITTNRSATENDTFVLSMPGYFGMPRIGDQVLVLGSRFGDICLGVANPVRKMVPGEILICNQAGAMIKLMDNGQVQINSKVFD